jgi:hypothetical protein
MVAPFTLISVASKDPKLIGNASALVAPSVRKKTCAPPGATVTVVPTPADTMTLWPPEVPFCAPPTKNASGHVTVQSPAKVPVN